LCRCAAMRDPATNAVIATVHAEAYAALKAAQERGGFDGDIEFDPARARALNWLIHDQTMPEHVQDDILRRYEEAPPPRKGKPSYGRRDICIVHVIRNLHEKYGLELTRNRSAKTPRRRPTICAIVAQALNKLGVLLSEYSVENIWSRRDGPDYTKEGAHRQLMAAVGMTPKAACHLIGVLRRARRPQIPT
jgi:hypothetical protein